MGHVHALRTHTPTNCTRIHLPTPAHRDDSIGQTHSARSHATWQTHSVHTRAHAPMPTRTHTQKTLHIHIQTRAHRRQGQALIDTRTFAPFASQEELHNGEDVARCPSCSLLLKVIYDPVRCDGVAERV